MDAAWQNSHLSQLNNGGEPNITSSLFFIIKVCRFICIYILSFFTLVPPLLSRETFFFFKKLELISLVTLSKDFCIRNKFTWISFHIKAWRSFNIGSRETLNGDTSSSSLAAKGFRSVRPNLQEKKSPTQVNRELYTVTLPLTMLCFQKKRVIHSLGWMFPGFYPNLYYITQAYIHLHLGCMTKIILHIHSLLLSPTLNFLPGVKYPAMKCPLS